MTLVRSKTGSEETYGGVAVQRMLALIGFGLVLNGSI